MKTALKSMFAAALLLAVATPVLAAPPAAPADATLVINGASTPAQGRPLYVYDKDGKDTSACLGPCTQSWPPLLAGADARPMGDWSVFSRTDGARQWAYKGMPAYGFYRDAPNAPAGGDNKVPSWRLLK